MKTKSLIFLVILTFMIVFSLGSVCADDSINATGEVSGDVDIATANPGSVSGELTYEIPSDANIKSADLYVNVYSGSAKNTHGANANVSIKTANGEKQLASEQLWIEDGSADGTIYTVNNHTDKCYSDYQMHYDITNELNGINSSSIVIKVDTFKMENKSFDGRIKLIALILAYDDGDNDKITYWINPTQLWTKTNITTIFNTQGLKDVYKASLTNIALSSSDGSFSVNDNLLGDADNHTSGGFYYQYNNWDITEKFENGKNTEFLSRNAGTSSYASLKNVLTVLKVAQMETDVSFATEYTSVNTCYAGTNNTLTVKANSNKPGKYIIELLADGVLVNSSEIDLDGENITTTLITDPTVRPIDETTVNGANNTKVTYAVNLKYENVTVGSANKTVGVLYNGNLANDMEYGVDGYGDVEKVLINGDIVIDVKEVSSYLGAAALNRTDVFNVALDNSSAIAKAYIYVPYNWFNGKTYTENIGMFNTTFNGAEIKATSMFRDQGNLGNYGVYGYGVIIYDVSDLIQKGNNTFVLNKVNPTPAVYPTVLVYMYNTAESTTVKEVSILNGADLLANSYNNAGRIVSLNNNIGVDSTNITNATLYVLAASAQKGEGNIIVNGKVFENVWNGTSSTTDLFSKDITDVVKNSNVISFVATGSTILALPQIIVNTYTAPIIETSLTAKALSTTYDSGKAFTVTVLDANKNPVKGLKLTLKVFTGKTYKNYYATTNAKGVASFASASKLAIGSHKVEITSSQKGYDVKKTSSTIKVAKAKTSVTAPKVTSKVKKSKYFKVTVKNKASKKVVKSIKVKVKVYTGKKFKTYTLKTNAKGVAQLNVKSLKVGTHKVVISSGNSKYIISKKSSIVIKK